MSTSPLFWLRPLSICLTSQLYLWEYIWSSQQILTSLFAFLQIKAHLSKFNLVFRSHSVLESLRKFGLALNLWKWQCSEGVVWFGFNELFLSLFPDNSWCPWFVFLKKIWSYYNQPLVILFYQNWESGTPLYDQSCKINPKNVFIPKQFWLGGDKKSFTSMQRPSVLESHSVEDISRLGQEYQCTSKFLQ